MTAPQGLDGRFEILIGRALRIGVTASSVCLAAGLVLSAAAPASSRTVMNLGILLLIATPAARVALSIVEYAIAGDWTFTLLTAIVF